MIRAFFVLLLLATVAPEARAECPWGDEVESVYATMTTITINGRSYSVKGEAARMQFISNLSECGVKSHVIAKFQEWRSMRRWTNISGIVGGCCFYPALLATPVTAVLAGQHKTELVMMLQTPG